MRKDNSEFITEFLSESGMHLVNRDYFAFVELDDLACWVLADGLDQDLEALSAEIAVQSVLDQFTEQPTISKRKLKRYVRKAHKVLQAASKRVRLKCSLLIVVTDYSEVVWASVGHTRLYVFREGKLHLQSKDQSVAERMAHAGTINKDRVDSHEERHNLLSYLGMPGQITPSFSKQEKLQDQDVLVLCTAGLWEGVNRVEMLEAYEEADSPQMLIDTLEDIMLSKQQQVVDNYSMVTIFANKVYQAAPKKRSWKWVKTVAMLLIPMILFGSGAIVYKVRSAQIKAETVALMVEHENNGDKEAGEGDFADALIEYSEARNASIKLKNKLQTKLINEKKSVVEWVVEGDDLFKEADYEKAIEKYEQALKEAESYEDFDMNDVEASLKKAQAYLVILGVMKQGDIKFEAKDFVGAKALYEKAHKDAMMAAFEPGQQQIAAKMTAVDEEMKAIKQEEQLAKGEKTEEEGDKQLAREDYAKAIATYTIAQNIYQQAELTDKVLAVQYKIIEAQEKLNPPKTEEPPEGTGEPNAGGAGD